MGGGELREAPRRRATRTASEIQFFDFDRINGPFHTNDDILTCGNPVFGRSTADKIEVVGPRAGLAAPTAPAAPARPCSRGRSRPARGAHGDAAHEREARRRSPQSAYTFTGKTTIRFNSGGGMTVTNPYKNGGAAQNMALPANGVIYVKNGR